LICLHEVIIHLAYGYLFYISEGKISPESPKLKAKSEEFNYKNNPCDDGGSYFEYLLFGEKIHIVNFNFVIRLLNGHFTNLDSFKKELKMKIDLKDNKNLGEFLQKVLKQYPINPDYKYDTLEAAVRSKYSGLQYIRRNYYPDCIKI
jgi:hypothetical protein